MGPDPTLQREGTPTPGAPSRCKSRLLGAMHTVPCTCTWLGTQHGHVASAQAVNTHWETQGVHHRACVTRLALGTYTGQEVLATHLQAHTPGAGEWASCPRTHCQTGSTSNTTLAHSSWQTIKAWQAGHTRAGTHTCTHTRVMPA